MVYLIQIDLFSLFYTFILHLQKFLIIEFFVKKSGFLSFWV